MRDALWVDLEAPSAEELAEVGQITGLAMPSRAGLVEIETSSRLAVSDTMLTLTMPLIDRSSADGPRTNPAGFVLTPQRLVSIHFAPSHVFQQFAAKSHELGAPGNTPGSVFVFIGLMEALVDRLADGLERIRDELDVLSHAIFRRQRLQAHRKGRQRREQEHGIARIVPFTLGAAPWIGKGAAKRLQTVQQDVGSLNEFSNHLTDKVQFLLDATLGLINVAQNNLMKVLTIVSVVGIPPTLVAGIYGMNFKYIPELHWDFGYAYGLGVIVITAILPLVWFRYKGWV